LNSNEVLETIQEHLGVSGMFFKDAHRFTKNQISNFYQIDIATIDRYLEENELKHNGYVVIKGKLLQEFKDQFGVVANLSSKTSQLGLFNFRVFLNLGMLLIESKMAKAIRSKILDIVIDSLNHKSGG
jgi:hypothetical protein